MYATKFGEEGHDVVVAANADEALTKLSDNSVDLVLFDMVMPGKTGLDLLNEMREQQGEAMPVCVALSNQSDEEDKQAALSAGAHGYIVKAELIPSEVLARVEDIYTNAK